MLTDRAEQHTAAFCGAGVTNSTLFGAIAPRRPNRQRKYATLITCVPVSIAPEGTAVIPGSPILDQPVAIFPEAFGKYQGAPSFTHPMAITLARQVIQEPANIPISRYVTRERRGRDITTGRHPSTTAHRAPSESAYELPVVRSPEEAGRHI